MTIGIVRGGLASLRWCAGLRCGTPIFATFVEPRSLSLRSRPVGDCRRFRRASVILGIDASNIRAGGGITHLTNLLRVAQPGGFGFSQVVLWGGRDLLD